MFSVKINTTNVYTVFSEPLLLDVKNRQYCIVPPSHSFSLTFVQTAAISLYLERDPIQITAQNQCKRPEISDCNKNKHTNKQTNQQKICLFKNSSKSVCYCYLGLLKSFQV